MGKTVSTAPLFVFSGGGTGGHLYPGLAVAETLLLRQPDAEIVFFTTDRDLDRRLLEQQGRSQVVQSVRPFTSKPWRMPAFIWALMTNTRAARRFIRTRRPRAVLGLGGYAAAPPVIAARREGTPSAILNPDAVPGRSNRWLAAGADVAFLQWDAAAGLLPRRAAKEVVGCPIRRSFRTATRDAGCAAFGLDPARPVLVVTGASQGARTVNEAATMVWPTFWKSRTEWQLLHLAGADNADVVRRAYEDARVAAAVVDFTHEMHLALAAADVVVSRAGASTLAELTALGKPSILFPYPYHRDQHQRENGRVLERAGAAILLEDRRDARLNADPLREALARLAEVDARERMAAAAQSLGRADAADRVAEWLLSR